MNRIGNMRGMRYGMLTVKSEANPVLYADGKTRRRWHCQCQCGNSTIVTQTNLRSGHTISCGCQFHKTGEGSARYKHGMSHSVEHYIWRTMIRRCESASCPKYNNYGGRGIRVCSRWRKSFRNFYDDMGPRPGPHFSIERIDNDGIYCPDNCKWATAIEQANNKRNNHVITVDGQSRTLAEWSRLTGISQYTIRTRICRQQWTPKRAVNEPVRGAMQ